MKLFLLNKETIMFVFSGVKPMTYLEQSLHLLLDPHSWVGAIFYAVIFCIAAAITARGVRIAAQRVMAREDLVDPTVVMFLTQLAQIAVYVIALIVFFHLIPALNKIGTALLTGVSVMSVVFGLAAQNTLGNLVAGCTLLLYRPFHLDDLIQVATPTGTESGIVERLTLGYTMLRTLDDRLVVVPNSLMASQVSLNLNRGAIHSMAIVPVGVDNAHADIVRKALLEIAHKSPKIHNVIRCLKKPLEDQNVILSLRAWCADTNTAAEIKNDVALELRKRFTGENFTLLLPETAPAPKAPDVTGHAA
jgi:small-conductance mechanosensitive channel